VVSTLLKKVKSINKVSPSERELEEKIFQLFCFLKKRPKIATTLSTTAFTAF
jgi:hypothetical protein